MFADDPLTITHDLLTIIEPLYVPFRSFRGLKDVLFEAYSRLLTISHDFSRLRILYSNVPFEA